MSGITRLRRASALLGIATIVGLTAACGASGDAASADGDLTVVTLDGVLNSPMAVPIMMVAEEGIDEKHGFKLEWQEGDPAGGTTRFLRGDFDIMASEDSVVAAVANGEGHDTVWWYPMMTNYASICASGDSGYATPEDLAGQQVGHFGNDSGTTQSVALSLQDGYGIDVFNDMTLLESPAAALPELMTQGEFDAMFNFEPHCERGIQETGGERIFEVAKYWQEETDGWAPSLTGLWSHRDWLRENPELAENVRAAFTEAMDRIIEDDYAVFAEEPYASQIDLNGDEEVQRLIGYCQELPCFVNEWTEESVDAEMEYLQLMVDAGMLDGLPENAPAATLEQILADQ